jgi:hypothetical protein
VVLGEKIQFSLCVLQDIIRPADLLGVLIPTEDQGIDIMIQMIFSEDLIAIDVSSKL